MGVEIGDFAACPSRASRGVVKKGKYVPAFTKDSSNAIIKKIYLQMSLGEKGSMIRP
jgi:hypothetical protein